MEPNERNNQGTESGRENATGSENEVKKGLLLRKLEARYEKKVKKAKEKASRPPKEKGKLNDTIKYGLMIGGVGVITLLAVGAKAIASGYRTATSESNNMTDDISESNMSVDTDYPTDDGPEIDFGVNENTFQNEV